MSQSADWKVLLIDDEEGIRKVTAISLEDAGYSVQTAPNGEAGINLCKNFSPQIVITDVRMPGMDGIQVLETVKKLYPDIEVIVATAFGEMELAIRALQLDASDFITKPINSDALHLALERAKHRCTSRKQIKDYTALLEEGWSETTRELMETFKFQNNLIENSMDGIMGCDVQGKVVTFNRSMEQIVGYAKKEALQKMTFSQFFFPEDEARFRKEIESEKYGGPDRLFLFETALKGKAGQRIPVQVSASVMKNQEHKSGLVCFFRDLREIRRLEREVEDQARILHQDKMMSLGRLAASVVHEINNPLAGILNYSRLMLRILSRGPLAEDRREKFSQYLELIEKETDRCSRIVSGLLTFSRKSPPSFGQVQIRELLERCILMSRHKLELSNIRTEQQIDADIPDIKGDFNQLQQCVINLIFNAIDAMPQGGTLTLTGTYDAAKHLAAITVKDTGTGISEKDLPHIFEPFFTTKDEGYGVGLGLSTLYGIVQRHGGTVAVESSPGQGAVFMLRFPV